MFKTDSLLFPCTICDCRHSVDNLILSSVESFPEETPQAGRESRSYLVVDSEFQVYRLGQLLCLDWAHSQFIKNVNVLACPSGCQTDAQDTL